MDVEDVGNVVSKVDKSRDEPSNSEREMVTPTIRQSLTKQGRSQRSRIVILSLRAGYRIVGSHSGVKLCRWTKSMLRGRGGCYKHTFYGIESHRCMEATPSLACANKCVFCWRCGFVLPLHHF